jgi:tetratricopeptide (TPR) repeat protein
MENTRLQQIRILLASEPEDEFLNYALALELEKDGKPEEAIGILQQLLSKSDNYLGAYYKLGNLLEQCGRPEEARAVYTKGIAIASHQCQMKTLAELKEVLQQMDEA